jgi:hypothetical protein
VEAVVESGVLVERAQALAHEPVHPFQDDPSLPAHLPGDRRHRLALCHKENDLRPHHVPVRQANPRAICSNAPRSSWVNSILIDVLFVPTPVSLGSAAIRSHRSRWSPFSLFTYLRGAVLSPVICAASPVVSAPRLSRSIFVSGRDIIAEHLIG